MDDSLRDLTANGFTIFPQGDTFVLAKMSVPESPFEVQDMPFISFVNACEYALGMLTNFRSQKIMNYTAVVRYDRGLGIEYRALKDLFAESQQDAQRKAMIEALSVIVEPKAVIKEIKVRPKV